MENIKLYEVDEDYIDYLSAYAPHLFLNSTASQKNTRKYLGIILRVNGFDYLAPLSSFKPKHANMKEGLDFLKVQDYAVINLNNMFPVPPTVYTYFDFSTVTDKKYKSLLLAEYRCIKSMQAKIYKNATALYKHKLSKGETTSLAKRCNDFALLESKCAQYLH